jgi:hypothetical protein
VTESGSQDGTVFDPEPLTAAQRSGRACVSCSKRWPRPRIRVGWLPDGSPVMACDDCGPGIREASVDPASSNGR